MKMPTRNFSVDANATGEMGLILGVTGPSGSGKTFSALRLAKGMQTVLKGKTFGIDTDSGRMRHYKNIFEFERVPLDAPYGPLDYLAAIEYCAKQGAKVILVDHMTHEHSGDGGVLDQIEKFLDDKCGDNYGKRQSMNMVAQVRPKSQRKVLNRRIVQMTGIIFILCYQAVEKVKPKKKRAGTDDEGGMEILGWQADTTSILIRDMTARFLLTPGCDGFPTFNPETAAEKMATKNPWQFRGWFNQGLQLNEDLGAKMARWHLGLESGAGVPVTAGLPAPAPKAAQAAEVVLGPIAKGVETRFKACETLQALQTAFEDFNEHKGELTAPERVYLADLKNTIKTKLGG